MPHKDPVKRKEYQYQYRMKNKEKRKELARKYYEENKEQISEYNVKYRETLKHNAINSISSGEIIDQNKWDMMCNEIKRSAKYNKHPYSDDFTNNAIFDMMSKGCFYCGEVAITIDRMNSKLDHTLDNCVGCCWECNNSKGDADPATFIRKAYYRARGEYCDDDIDIWFVHKNKPAMWSYQRSARMKGVSFDITKEYFDILIKGDCAYCHRSPSTWFGIDRIVPSIGYVNGNVESCCWDCNSDKSENNIEMMKARNERISCRVDIGLLVLIECDKVVLHRGTRPLI
jgi:hypothetical protein